MTDYIKLYSTFFTGSMRGEGVETRLFFLALITLADPDGVVTGATDFLAMYAGVLLADAEKALTALQAPDPSSTTPDEEGRRIEPWGPNRWRVINYRKYYERSRQEQRREYKAAWQKAKRGQVRTGEDTVDRVDTRTERKGKEIEKKGNGKDGSVREGIAPYGAGIGSHDETGADGSPGMVRAGRLVAEVFQEAFASREDKGVTEEEFAKLFASARGISVEELRE